MGVKYNLQAHDAPVIIDLQAISGALSSKTEYSLHVPFSSTVG